MNGFTDKPKLPWEEVLSGGPGQNLFMSPQVKPPDMGTIVSDVGTVSTPREPWEEILKPQKSVPAQTQGPAPAQAKEPWETILKPEPKTREDIASLFLPKPVPVVPPKPSLMGELGKGIMQGLYQTKEMGGGLMALGAEALRSASSAMEPITAPVKEFGIETMQAAQKSMEPYQGAVPSYKNIGGVQDALYYLSHGVGTLLPMIAMSIASGGVGAAAGKMLAKNYVKTLAERMALEGIPGEIINASVKQGLLRGIERGALLGGYASSLAMEAGSITADKVKEGQDIEPLRVMMGAIPAAALDVLPQFSLAKRTGLLKRFGLSKAEAELAEEAVKKMPASFLGRVGKEAGIQFLQEAPTEAIQSVFENWAAHKDLTSQESIDDFIDSFLIGGAGGALFGGIGGAMQRKPSPQQPVGPGIPPILPPIVDPAAAPVITPAPIQAQPEPGVTPPGTPPVTPPLELEPTPALAPPPAPSGPVIPPQPAGIPAEVVEKVPPAPSGEAIPGMGEERPAVFTSESPEHGKLVKHSAINLKKVVPYDYGAETLIRERYTKLKDELGTVTYDKIAEGTGLEVGNIASQIKKIHENNPYEIRFIVDRMGNNVAFKIKNEREQIESGKPEAPKIPIAEVIKPPMVEGVRIGGVESNYLKWFEQKLKDARSESHGQNILDDLDSKGIAPGDVHEKFWKDTYWKLNGEQQEYFKKYAKRLFNEDDPIEIAKLARQDSPLKHSQLEGTERGYWAMMDEANRIIEAPKSPVEPGKVGVTPAPIMPLEALPKAETVRGPVTEPTAPVIAKEPWQMTRDDYISSDKVWIDYKNKSDKAMQARSSLEPGTSRAKITTANARWAQYSDARDLRENRLIEDHQKVIQQALSEGKPVPAEVLKDYPDLALEVPAFPKQEALKKVTEPIPTAQQVREIYKPIGQRETPEEPRLTTELTPDWKDNLFTEREYSAQKPVEFLAANSPVLENRTLFQALLSNNKVLQKLQRLPIAIVDTTETVGKPGKAYYDSGEHRIFIDEDYANSSKERLSGTVLEEIVHGLTHQSMTAQDKLELTAMMNRAISFLPENERMAARKVQPMYEHAYLKMAGLTSQGRAVYYAFTSIDEFLAGAIRHPEVRDFLKSIPEMKGINKPITLWDRFTQWMSRVIFGDVENASLLKQVLEKAGELIERPTDYQLTEAGKTGRLFAMEDPSFKALTSPSFPGNVAEDKKFDPYLGKHRLLLNIPDPDLKRWKEIGVLPSWLAKEYPEFNPFLQTQERREEKRSELKTEKFKQKEPFTFLKGEELVKTEKAIVAGDAEEKVWTDTQLTEKFNLSAEGIAAYKSVRTTLNDIFKINLDRAETAITDNARKSIDSVFAKLTTKIEARKESEQKNIVLELLKTAHDLTLSDAETTHLETLLKETKAAIVVPLKTVKDKLVKIFNEVLTEKDKQKLLTDYEGAYEKAQTTIGEVREIIYNTLGGDVEQKNLDEITKGLVLAYIRTERPTNTLKELRAEFGKAKGYSPRDHGKGKYEVYVTQESFDTQGQTHTRVIWNHFFDQIEGTTAYKALKQDPEFNKPGMEIGVRLHKQEPDSSFFRASLTNLQRLTDNAIEEMKQKGTISPELADEVKFQVLYELSDQFKARGAARHFIHRADYLIKGYKEIGLNEVLNNYISGWAGMLTKQDAAGEFLEHMKDIPKDKPKLQNYASKYTTNMLRNDENIDQVLGKMRGLVFTYFLGGVVRGGFLNSTQSLTTTIPFLAREVGWKSLKAEKIVFGSAFDIATGRISEIETRLLEEAHRKGITEAQYINTIIREAGDRFGKTLGRIIELLSKPFAFFETKNREIAALSYFRAKYPELLKTMSETEAYDKAFAGATTFINDTQYLMTKGNLPNWASGADIGSQFARTAYVFRKFNHNYLLGLRSSLTGPDGKLALDVMGRSLAYMALLGGLTAIPFLDDLLDEWEKFFGQPVRQDIKRNLGNLGGPALAKMGIMGIPSLIGIDMSGSLKLGLPFVGTPSENIFGVWSGLGKKFMNAKDSAEKGEILRAIESASPVFIESVLKAYRMMEYGATTPSGKIMFDEKGQPIKTTGAEAAVQALGFRPERISEISRTRREYTNLEKNFDERHDNLLARFRLAKTSPDRAEVIRDVQRYNMDAQKYRGAVPMINAESLRKSFISKPEKRYVAFGNQPGA